MLTPSSTIELLGCEFSLKNAHKDYGAEFVEYRSENSNCNLDNSRAEMLFFPDDPNPMIMFRIEGCLFQFVKSPEKITHADLLRYLEDQLSDYKMQSLKCEEDIEEFKYMNKLKAQAMRCAVKIIFNVNSYLRFKNV